MTLASTASPMHVAITLTETSGVTLIHGLASIFTPANPSTATSPTLR